MLNKETLDTHLNSDIYLVFNVVVIRLGWIEKFS